MLEYDPRFDEAEAEISRGDAWRFREDDAPNPLTILATDWSNGHTKHGAAEFLAGVDREGKRWSVLVGSLVLRKRLIDGEVSEWDDNLKALAVVDTQGRVQPGEVVSIRFKGDVESGNGKLYPDFEVVRKPPADSHEPPSAIAEKTRPVTSEAETPKRADADDIPF